MYKNMTYTVQLALYRQLNHIRDVQFLISVSILKSLVNYIIANPI